MIKFYFNEPFGMCMASHRYEIADAFEEHHLMGMIYHTNHNRMVSRQYAYGYECWKKIFHLKCIKYWMITHTLAMMNRRMTFHNADIDNHVCELIVQYVPSDVRASYRFGWKVYRIHGKRFLVFCVICHNLCTKDADLSDICGWNPFRKSCKKMVFHCHGSINELPEFPYLDMLRCNECKHSVSLANATDTNDAPNLYGI